MTSNAQEKTSKNGMQHYLLFLALVVVFSYGCFQFVIPTVVQGAVIALFKPHDERLRENFVAIMPNLHAVKTENYKGALAPGTKLKAYIKTDYIFDFTSEARSERLDGYTKGAGEWVVKANGEGGLGEAAIILEPAMGFTVMSLALGFTIAIFLTFFLPSSIGYMASKVDREIEHTKSKIRLQTGFADEVVELLVMPDADLRSLEPHQVRSSFKFVWDRTSTDDEDLAMTHGRRQVRFEEVFTSEVDLVEFRAEVLLLRIKEFFSDFVVKEIVDTKNAIDWTRNRMKFFKGLRLYMSHHFTEKYSNNVTGLAYAGAAILIVVIGVRGLKFIPPTKPSLILASISLEGTMLALLAFTLIYTEEEERMDKMMKKMEDANHSQLETMKDVSVDIRSMADALVGETSELIKRKVEMAIAEALASDENVKRVVSDKVAEKIIVAMRQAFPERQ
jgi:hypothetical protein